MFMKILIYEIFKFILFIYINGMGSITVGRGGPYTPNTKTRTHHNSQLRQLPRPRGEKTHTALYTKENKTLNNQ